MRILIVTQYFHPENFRINDFADSFIERGHQVTVLTAIPNYPGGKYYTGYGIFKKGGRYIKISGYFVPRFTLENQELV